MSIGSMGVMLKAAAEAIKSLLDVIREPGAFFLIFMDASSSLKR
jgi:hypothetical protein